jgi:hypothetical protein
MPTPPILEAPTIDWTYEDLTEELEQLAMLEDLEEPAGPSLADLPELLVDSELARVAEDLETVAALEGR